MEESALSYARFGWRVFPVKPGGKAPASMHGVKDATGVAQTIEAWWELWPEANIGIATGTVSGIVVVDIDHIPVIEALREHGKEFPETATVRTPNGLHLYFQAPQEPVRNSASKLAKGVDVRGDGGYVLAPPSVVGGESYRWIDKRRPVPLPEWVLEDLTKRRAPEEPTPFEARPLATAGLR